MMNEIGRRAKVASRQLARAKTDQKNQTLLMLADRLIAQRELILRENVKDVEAATDTGLVPALIDRLALDDSRLNGVAADVRRVASLPDPVGEQFDHTTLPNGLKLHKQRVPLGVLGVIYESRPNVTIDVAALAIKTGNVAILRGGSETLNTNRALINVVHHALEKNQLPVTAIQFIDDPDRARVTELLALHDYVDVIIPRGGAALHKFCRENSRITVITGGIGICHLFVDESADLEKAVEVIHNAKTQRPTVCNALDVVLVHRAVAANFLPRVVARLAADGVTFRAEPRAISNLQSLISNVQPATETDFDTEWLSLVLSLKVVDNLDEAIDHIAQHSTAHSDGILTRNTDHANRFIAEVDSAAVYVNASTRFTDGGEFGLGAEVAVSTQRLHARGPMGLRELTTYKWVGVGDY
ncbi:MAG: glutamate-5-semialdehyde dehydrogenase, partial [Chloroflexota bacterium]